MARKRVEVAVIDEGVPQMSQFDLARLLIAQCKAESLASRLETEKLRRQLLRTKRDLEILTLVDKYRLADEQAAGKITDTEELLAPAKAEHVAIHQEIGVKYKLAGTDWAYNELTGAIVVTPKG